MALSITVPPGERRRTVPDSKKPAKPKWWQRPVADTAAEPFFPDGILESAGPDAQAQWIVEQFRTEMHMAVDFLVKQKRVASSPTDLDGAHPAYLLRSLGMQALDMEIDPKLTFREAVKRLQWAWDLLNERANEQDAFERHTPANAAEAAVHGALLDAAAQRGEPIGPDSERGQVAVADVVGRAKAAVLQTAQFPGPLYTPGMTDPREAASPAEVEVTQVLAAHEFPPSPVHVDGMAAPLPGVDEVADSAGPLPRRLPNPIAPVEHFPAALGDDARTPVDVNPAEAQDIADGDWLLILDKQEFTGEWVFVREARPVGDDMHLQLAGEFGQLKVHFTAPVFALSPAGAQERFALLPAIAGPDAAQVTR